jgi:hypothetical protein
MNYFLAIFIVKRREFVASELPRMPLSHTLVDNERLGSDIQTLTTPELMFRALLTEDGALRLALART